jgi:hypothetical protein
MLIAKNNSNGLENVPTQKLLWCINFQISKKGVIGSQPGKTEMTKFITKHGFWMRLAFI